MAESATEPNTGLQGFVGLLGVLSVPVVGYSLYTLYKTGDSHGLFTIGFSSSSAIMIQPASVSDAVEGISRSALY